MSEEEEEEQYGGLFGKKDKGEDANKDLEKEAKKKEKEDKKKEKEDKKNEKKENKKKEKEDKKNEKKENKEEGDSKGSGCPPGEFCLGRDFANSLTKKGDAIENIKNAGVNWGKKKVTNIKNKIVETATNPLKCAATVANTIPNAVEKMFDIVENGFNRVGNAAENALEKSATLVLEDPIAPFKVFVYDKINNIQKFFGNILLGDDASKILLDPNMNPDKILEGLLQVSQSFTKIFENPEFQKVFDEWLTNYATALDKGVNMAKPKFTAVTDKVTGVITDSTKKIGDAVGSSLTNIIGAVLKSIPVVGAIFNGAELAKKVAGKIIAICEPAVSKGGLAAFTLANMGMNQVNKTKCKVTELKNKIEPIMKKIQGTAGSSTQAGGSLVQAGGSLIQAGGSYNSKKATRRVQRLLQQFTRRRMINTNYAKQISKFRK